MFFSECTSIGKVGFGAAHFCFGHWISIWIRLLEFVVEFPRLAFFVEKTGLMAER